MTTATITKTLKKVNNDSLIYSLGFRRLRSLPSEVRKNVNLAFFLKCDRDTSISSKKQIDFLEGLSEGEYIYWMKNL